MQKHDMVRHPGNLTSGEGVPGGAWGQVFDGALKGPHLLAPMLLAVSEDVPEVDILRSPLIKVATIFKGLVGYVNNPLCSPNPFLKGLGGWPDHLVGLYSTLPDAPVRSIVESLLRDVAAYGIDAVTGVGVLLSVMPLSMLGKCRKAIVSSLEKDRPAWNGWKQFSSKHPDSMSAEELGVVKELHDRFWDTMCDLFQQCGQVLQDSIITERARDPEALLKEWRNISGYFTEASAWDDVFRAEALIFSELCLHMRLGWATRRDHLISILNGRLLNLDKDLFTFRLIDLYEAEDYASWIGAVQEIMRIAELRGWVFNLKSQSRVKFAEEVGSPREGDRVSKSMTDTKVVIKSTYPPSTSAQTNRQQEQIAECKYCHKSGHTVDNCRKLERKNGDGTPSQTIHKVSDIAQPTKTISPKEDEHIPRDPQPRIAAPKVSQSMQLRSGRTLHTTLLTEQIAPEDLESNPLNQVNSEPICESEKTCLHTITTDIPTNYGEPSELMRRLHVTVAVDGTSDSSIEYVALLDSGSNVNYVCRSVVERLRTEVEIIETRLSDDSLVQTMSGTVNMGHLSQTVLSLAIRDSNGEWSQLRKDRFIIYEGEDIPGGTQFLLSDTWPLELGLQIEGHPAGFRVVIPKSNSCQDSAVQTGADQCLHSIAFQVEDEGEEEEFEEDDIEMATIMSELEQRAISQGPLSRAELEAIRDRIHLPELIVTLRQGMEYPPIHEEGYPTTKQRSDNVMEVLNTLTEQGIIAQVPRHSGNFVSPGFGVRKPNGKTRLVVNLKALNTRVERPVGIRYHDSKRWLESLPSWSQYFACLDVKDAFYAIPCHPSAQPYLHMSVYTTQGYREYKWLRMPQGFCSSPGYWCAYIESSIKSIEQFLDLDSRYQSLRDSTRIIPYADDILIVGRDEEHTRLLSDIVHQALTYNRLYIPEEKYQRCSSSVVVMGLELLPGQVRFAERNVAKVKNLGRPQNRKQLESAVGLLGYVRWSLNDRDSDRVLHVLHGLRESKQRFHWTEEHQAAWDILVSKFNNLPLYTVSRVPGVEFDLHKKVLVIQTDASDIAVGFAAFLIDESYLSNKVDIQALCQLDAAQLVAVGSRKLKGSELHYVPHDKEGLGIYHALVRLRKLCYLVSRTLLQSDNKTALSKFNGKEPAKVVRESASTVRGRRWLRMMTDVADLLAPAACDVSLVHIAGLQNNLADYLSRYVYDDLCLREVGTQTDSHSLCLATRAVSRPAPDAIEYDPTLRTALQRWLGDESVYVKHLRLMDIWLHLQHRLPEIGQTLDAHARSSYLRKVSEVCAKRFQVADDILYVRHGERTLIVVPNTDANISERSIPLRTHLVEYFHEHNSLASHRGEKHTMAELRRIFWWPGMDQDVHNFITTCQPCQLSKATTSPDFHSRVITFPNECLYVDWAGPLADTNYILVLVDSFTGYTMAFPYPSKSSDNAVDGLLAWISLLGSPRTWSSDNDSTFCSAINRDLRASLGIRDLNTPSYSPNIQGVVERRVGDIKHTIERFALDPSITIDLRSLLHRIVWSINCSPLYGSYNGLTPFELMLGRLPHHPLATALMGNSLDDGQRADEADSSPYLARLKQHLDSIHAYWTAKLSEARSRAVDHASESARTFAVGESVIRVLYRQGRRELLHVDARILRRLGSNLYEYQYGGQVFIAPAHQLCLLKHREPDAPVSDPDTVDEWYPVESLVDYDPNRGYLVQWAGYSARERTWQLAGDLPPALYPEMQSRRNARGYL